MCQVLYLILVSFVPGPMSDNLWHTQRIRYYVALESGCLFLLLPWHTEATEEVGCQEYWENKCNHIFLLLFFSALLPSPPQQQRRAEPTGDASITESKCPQSDVSWCVQGAQESRPLCFFSGILSGCQRQWLNSTWFTIMTLPCFKLFKLQAKYGYWHFFCSFPENSILLQMNKIFWLSFQNFDICIRMILWWSLVILSNNSTYLTKFKRI